MTGGVWMSSDDAAREIYRASHQRLVVQLYGITGDLQEAQDAVQEAFVRGLSRRRLATVDNPEAWLRTVAVNIARSRWRRRQAMNALLLRRAVAEPVPVPGMSEDHVAVITALRQLPRAQRETVVLHYLTDLPVDEVARAMGVATGTVKSRLHRARARLADLLDPTEPAVVATGSCPSPEENHV
jgi:RNA polymerase sigma-70 factor (sigma-E family)